MMWFFIFLGVWLLFDVVKMLIALAKTPWLFKSKRTLCKETITIVEEALQANRKMMGFLKKRLATMDTKEFLNADEYEEHAILEARIELLVELADVLNKTLVDLTLQNL